MAVFGRKIQNDGFFFIKRNIAFEMAVFFLGEKFKMADLKKNQNGGFLKKVFPYRKIANC